MYSRLVMMGLEGSFYIIAALPFLVCWAVRFFRKEGKGAWKLAAGFLVFVLYLCCVAAVMGLPSLQYLTFDPNLQMIPFYHLWPERVHNVQLRRQFFGRRRLQKQFREVSKHRL